MISPSENKKYIAGIGGGSASGKTYFLHALRKRFGPEELCIISQDDYYKPLAHQKKDAQGMVNYDLPDGIDEGQFVHDLHELIHGKTITRQQYMFNQPGVTGNMLELRPAPIIVVEGLFIFHFARIKALLDLKIFMSSREDIQLIRRLERDTTERGMQKEDVLYQWFHHVHPAYKTYLQPYQDEADLIITNNSNCDKALEVVLDHLGAVLARR